MHKVRHSLPWKKKSQNLRKMRGGTHFSMHSPFLDSSPISSLVFRFLPCLSDACYLLRMTSGQLFEETKSLTSLPLAAKFLDNALCEKRIIIKVIKYEKRCRKLYKPPSIRYWGEEEIGKLTPSEASAKHPLYAGSGPWPHSAGSYSILGWKRGGDQRVWDVPQCQRACLGYTRN